MTDSNLEQLALELPPPVPLIGPPAECPAEIAALFEHYALEVIGAGITRYSARAIFHRLRWFEVVERGNRDFKINNNLSAGLARWFMKKHPEHGQFFEIRGAEESE